MENKQPAVEPVFSIFPPAIVFERKTKRRSTEQNPGVAGSRRI